MKSLCSYAMIYKWSMSNFQHIWDSPLQSLRVKLEYSWTEFNKTITNVETCETCLQHDACNPQLSSSSVSGKTDVDSSLSPSSSSKNSIGAALMHV